MAGSELVSGSILGEKYQVQEKLGEGGLAVVYRGSDLLLGSSVAIKRFKASEYEGTKALEKILREARTQASLVHQNIVGHREILEHEGEYLLVMEYVDGTTLEELINASQTYPRLPLKRIAAFFSQLLDGLSYAHEQGVLHRDIKPANLMLTTGGQLKIADFGLAYTRTEQKLTQTGVVVGSPAYIAPEQIKGARDVDPRSDIYSVGVSLYEALCGGLPHVRPGENVPTYELISRLLFFEPYSLEEHGISLSRELSLVVYKSIAKEREERFADCGAFWEALEFALRNDPMWEEEASQDPLVAVSGVFVPVEKLKRIKYVSAFVYDFTAEELEALVAQAAKKNEELGITGFLAASGQLFFQIIEGPVEAVDGLFARIEEDPRHTNVMVLRESHNVRDRLFPDWSMRLLDLSEASVMAMAPLKEILQTIFMQRQSIDRLTLALEQAVSQEFIAGKER